MAYTKTPDADLLQAALVGYQRQQAGLEERIAEIRRELDGTAPSDAGEGKPRRRMSAAGRRRIAAAQRKRWAKLKKATPAKAKRKMSAAGRKRMVEAVRKRLESLAGRESRRGEVGTRTSSLHNTRIIGSRIVIVRYRRAPQHRFRANGREAAITPNKRPVVEQRLPMGGWDTKP